MPIVSLETSRRSRHFSDINERLWSKDLDHLVHLIGRHVDSLEDLSSEDEETGEPNLSIAVFGPAGSGKSSLLKTLVHECQKQKKEKKYERIASLDVLQPARFGDQDNLLFATVAAALDAHRKKHSSGAFEYENTTRVLDAYRNLDEHLRVVLGEELPKDLDPHALAAEHIQRHTSALKIKGCVNKFLDELAKDLNGDKDSVVLLPVDDLDLAHEHLMMGLRHLQAYLLHPRIVPVFCFTDRLAEEILAGYFANAVTKADSRRKESDRLSVSEQLAVQYLSKCFPVRNRIRLGPIPAMLQAASIRGPKASKLQRSENEKQSVIQLLTASSFLLFGVPDRDARHPVRAALRPSTLRRQFHVIDAVKEAKVDQLIGRWMQHTLIGDHQPKHDNTLGEHCSTIFDNATWSLMNVHRDVLREFNLHLEDLYSWTPHALRRVMLQALFKLPPEKQLGLWQRWRHLTDSRRSQVISLLAANIHRPWAEDDRPSGESYIQIVRWREEQEEEEKKEEQEERIETQVPASLALLWLLEVLVGFYLPLSRSVDRASRSLADHTYTDGKKKEKCRGEEDKQKPPVLSASGWTLHSAPVQAALAADDDGTLLPTGMIFLDPLSYATALTTVPRIEACRELDEVSTEDPEEWEQLKQIKLGFLSESTTETLKPMKYSWLKEYTDGTVSEKIKTRAEKAWEAFESAAKWEVGLADIDAARYESYEYLKNKLANRKYQDAVKAIESVAQSSERDDDIRVVKNLWAAANTVHDDQLLLRIWTCYGYNRGRFWAAASLWRGLGLMGQLLESYRRWYDEYNLRYVMDEVNRPGEENDNSQERKEKKVQEKIEEEIRGALRSHSLRGLVPGKDLGGGSQKGLIELAFSGWDSEGQKLAIKRLAKRLGSWLWHNRDKLNVAVFQGGNSRPRWSQCFVRRLHGGYVVGSLWQWLDAEQIEYQGRRYGKRRKYYWNAGVALTSWLRVFLRYLRGSHELRWLIESCPLTSPFLSRNSITSLQESLYAHSYHKFLQYAAIDEIDGKENDSLDVQSAKIEEASTKDKIASSDNENEPASVRNPEDFKKLAMILEEIWLNKRLEKLTTVPPVDSGSMSEDELEEIADEVANILAPTETDNRVWLDHLYEASEPELGDASDTGQEGSTQRGLFRLNRWAAKIQKDVNKLDELKARKYRERLRDALVSSHLKADGSVDVEDFCFSIASLIQYYWKLMAHASATSLFYQIPRVRRDDFFARNPKDNSKDP